jgi:copper(I)-binding protein
MMRVFRRACGGSITDGSGQVAESIAAGVFGCLSRAGRKGFFAVLIFLAACVSPEAPLVAGDVEITRPMPGRNMSAGFLVLENNSDTDIRVTGVTSPQFGAVEIHETTIEGGVSRMRELEALVVPANGSVTLERGGKHLMLMRGEDVGTSVTLQLLSDGEPLLLIEYTYPGENE